MAHEDTKALMSSEIFREYAAIQLAKEAAEPKVNEQEVLQAFADFEHQIQDNPKLLNTFKLLQNKISTDNKFKSTLDPKFASAVMLLDLSGE